MYYGKAFLVAFVAGIISFFVFSLFINDPIWVVDFTGIVMGAALAGAFYYFRRRRREIADVDDMDVGEQENPNVDYGSGIA